MASGIVIQTQEWKDLLKLWLGTRFLETKRISWKVFENRVAEILTAIGFEVRQEGHLNEGEPKPDGIFILPPLYPTTNRYWVVYDCKHKENCNISEAEVRAMIDYISNKKSELVVEGLGGPNIEHFFAYIALSFKADAEEGLRKIQQRAGIQGVLIPIRVLLYALVKRLQIGYKFNLLKFKKIFKGKIISEEDIDETLS